MSWVDDGTYITRLRDIDDDTEELLWGEHTDNNFIRVAQTVAGTHTYAIPGGTTDYTPSDTDIDGAGVTHKMRVVLTGAMTTNLNYVLPQRSGRWTFFNNTTDGGGGPYTVTVKMASGTTVVLAHGERAIIASDGTNLVADLSESTILERAASVSGESGVYTAAPKLGQMIDIWVGTTGGTATAITATVADLFASALPSQFRVSGIWGTSAAGAATTFQINSLTAASLLAYGTTPWQGEFYAGQYFQLIYESGAFKIVNPQFNITPTGTVASCLRVAAPDGWVLWNDGTIGDASSNATTRAHADCVNLFGQLWDAMAAHPAQFAIYDSGGSASTQTTKGADWAAHKAIRMPAAMGRVLVAAGSGSGLTARTLGQTIGAETASHNHTQNLSPSLSFGSGGGIYSVVNAASASTIQPSVVLPLMIKL